MREAVIVEAVRTPIGRRFGSLSGWHPAELAAEVLKAIISRCGIDAAAVDDVIMGCVTQVHQQSTNVARTAVLAAGFPESVPATTIDRQCGSSQQALEFAARGIVAGSYDIAIAAGLECMTTVPMFSNAGGDVRSAYGEAAHARYKDDVHHGHSGLVPQGISAEIIVDKWGLTREELDAYALRSQQAAATARSEGRFKAEIVPVQAKTRNRETGQVVVEDRIFSEDECIRSTSMEALAELKPSFIENGRVTAGNSSQIVDGAAAVLIMERGRAEAMGLKPRAVIRTGVVVGSNPVTMLDGPIPATRKVLEKSGLTAADIDLFEVNEAFAPVVLAWQKELGVGLDRLNVNGGGISLGHPLGASGARLMTTLLHELERRGARYGLQTMCEGGGMANATIIERVG